LTGARGRAAVDWLEVSRNRCDRVGLEQLWAAVPEPMRLSRFAESTVPAGYARPKYLFLAPVMNRNGDRPYATNSLRQLLTKLASRLDVRDSTGTLIDFNRTHRFRHTVATNLLNSGVPLHVVQRYLGHLTPAMSLIYAQTLQSTAEAELALPQDHRRRS
jgi:integrase